MIGTAQFRPRAGQHGIGLDQVGRRIGRAADLAVVAVLVLRATLRAGALDVAVGQEHALHGIVELLDRARFDEAFGLQRAVDRLRQLDVLGRIGRVPVVEADVEAVEVARPRGAHVGDELLRRLTGPLGRDHDRRAVRVLGADEVHGVAAHLLESHPDVGLDVLHDVADVERAVGVGQGGGDKEAAAGHGFKAPMCEVPRVRSRRAVSATAGTFVRARGRRPRGSEESAGGAGVLRSSCRAGPMSRHSNKGVLSRGGPLD